jgi:hypothetical protein
MTQQPNWGTYSEILPCGGELRVQPTSWAIHYYFAGPDLRYNGTLVQIQSSLVDSTVSAWQQNWEEYKRLKLMIPRSASFSTNGMCGMTINVGGPFDGVCLRSYHLRVATEDRLTTIIKSYVYANHRAEQVQGMLRVLGNLGTGGTYPRF